MDPRIRSLRDHIDRDGWRVLHVLPDAPAGPEWGYTVGMQEVGLPELIVFGERPTASHAILAQVRQLLLAEPHRARAGEDLGELEGDLERDLGPRRARLGAVAPRWLTEYPIWAVELYGPDVEVLQVVLADELGAFWEDEDCPSWVLQEQADLSRPDAPFRSPLLAGGWRHELAPDIFVLVPIDHAGQPEHRDEAVPAQRTGADRARILQPPALADRVTTGTEVSITPEPSGVLRAPFDLTLPTHPQLGIERRGPMIHLAFAFGPACQDDPAGSLDRVTRVIDRYDARASLSPGGVQLSVEPRHAERVRIAMRRLELDGLLIALPAYHRRSEVGDNPRCACCRRQRGE